MIGFETGIMQSGYTGRWWPDGATLALNFTRPARAMTNNVPASLASIMTTNRSSSAVAKNLDGSLVAFLANEPRVTDKGLLIEESRTNELTESESLTGEANSNTTLAASTLTAPHGLVAGTSVVSDTTSTLVKSIRFDTLSTTTITFSGYFKANGNDFMQIAHESSGNFYANFDLSDGTIGNVGVTTTASIENAGDGWWRCITTMMLTSASSVRAAIIDSKTAAAFATSTAAVGNGFYAFGVQSEEADTASSYIPTSGSSVTRVADDIRLVQSGSLPFAGFNSAEGTIVVEAQVQNLDGVQQAAYSFDDNTANIWLSAGVKLGGGTNDEIAFYAHSPSSDEAWIRHASAAVSNTNYRLASAWKENDFVSSVNGNTALIDTNGIVPAVTNLRLGNHLKSEIGYLNGYLQSLTYFPYRISNAELQMFSASI